MAKKSKPTPVAPVKAKDNSYHYDDYYCINSFKRKPVSDIYLDAFAKRMREWPDKPTNKDEDGDEPLRVDQFLALEGITYPDLYRWEKRHEGVRQAYAYLLMRLGRRREIGALKKKYDAGMVARTQWKYDSSDRDEQLRIEQREEDLIKLKAALKSEAEGNDNRPIIIQIPPTPSEVK